MTVQGFPPPPPSPPQQNVGAAGDAHIFERGYRRYDGERLGRAAAVRAVALHAFQRSLGLRRPVWAKFIPGLIIFISYVPAIVFVGLVALVKNEPNIASSLPKYSDYYGNVVLAVLLFVAFLAPDGICPDRRTGMLGIYLASPLTRDTYLLGKAIAVFTSLCLVTVGPQLLMLLANSLQGSGAGSNQATFTMAGRIVIAGVFVSLFFTMLSLAISSLTDRKGFATAAIILILLATGAIANALASNGQPAFTMLDLGYQLPRALTNRIFGVRTFDTSQQVATPVVYLATAGWTIGFAVVLRVRYQLLRVTR